MTVNRLLGAIVVAFGATLLLWLIPANVSAAPGSVMDPALFPRLAAWLLIGLGTLQLIVPSEAPQVPPLWEVLRLAGVAALTLAAVLLMPETGYILTSVVLMAALAVLVHERRIHWLAVIVAGLPVAIWLLFEIVLQRPLP
ncbi:tripartite tricarboxylate transporter TctB family protein [Psychromarinibacter sp. C21-152]|uniref:Tripartite tricarboxylate transporter TctB family protein n=1 Tax=Psychromarinibacter sediminicola TaxID=3033385 RepID=A0AAE3NR14_9RHOB|nr:tripartite tricarboxylate transporter TctB family protein [Psychromarinibacter sediminicola]MDF0600451.1 tripartite tricarboxylate transporter TctB family protein [Psychromarinibacter sediminicola]